MANYTLNKYDFKKFLLVELPDARQEELIFWKKTIPMPVDLIYGIFENRGELLRKYLDHIGGACLLAFVLERENGDWRTEMASQPSPANKSKATELTSVFQSCMKVSGVPLMLKRMAELLLLDNYEPDEKSFVRALCHEGRKYNRLYIPPHLKQILSSYFPQILSCIARTNGDMFSNVVADELKIYRMGFADAFTGIFNKLIDFILDHSNMSKRVYANGSSVKLVQDDGEEYTNDLKRTTYGVVSDGSMWEPRYDNAATSVVLNKHHPFCDVVKIKGDEAHEVMTDLVSVFAEVENEILKDSERKVIEVFRHEVSRRLRIKAERNNF